VSRRHLGDCLTALVLLLAGGGGLTTVAAAPAAASGGRVVTVPSAWDWPTYGQNAQHTFSARTTLTKSSAGTLRQRWFFPTNTAVTVDPTVVDGTVYAGSWDQYFYAVNLYTGKLEWKFHTFPQPAVTPYPGQNPRDIGSDGGMITSSAWFQPGNGTRPDLVIFGGGYTLYALNAHTGKLYWSHAYTGNPTKPPDPTKDDARIFSSPTVFDTRVLFGLSVDGQTDERGYVVAASLATGKPDWVYQSDRNSLGKIPDDGCGNVWSSGSILPKQGWVVFDEADCNFADPPPTAESVFALRISNGSLVWRYRPNHTPKLQCDWDFGATVNIGLGGGTRATFLGVGSKDGTYYSLDPTNGKLRWKTNVVFGGFSGGFIATTAYDGSQVFGATALGDYGRFETNGSQVCDPSTPRDVANQQPSIDAFDAGSGKVLWQGDTANSFGSTTYAGGLVFNSKGLASVVTVRNAKTGKVIDSLPLQAMCWSGISVVGNSVIFGTGTSTQGSPDGIALYTPKGEAPRVPGETPA
jgi:outer membrane protein assembly factor BamB